MSITGMTLSEFCRQCADEEREMLAARRKWLRARRLAEDARESNERGEANPIPPPSPSRCR